MKVYSHCYPSKVTHFRTIFRQMRCVNLLRVKVGYKCLNDRRNDFMSPVKSNDLNAFRIFFVFWNTKQLLIERFKAERKLLTPSRSVSSESVQKSIPVEEFQNVPKNDFFWRVSKIYGFCFFRPNICRTFSYVNSDRSTRTELDICFLSD